MQLAQLCQNFEVSGGSWGGWNPPAPPPYATACSVLLYIVEEQWGCHTLKLSFVTQNNKTTYEMQRKERNWRLLSFVPWCHITDGCYQCFGGTFCHCIEGRDSSVGIATGYGLDGPGIESRQRRDFSHTSRPALGPIQPPVQWVVGLSQG
jgi:hypothetical protein